MAAKRYEGGFREIKKVKVMDTREGEELHFTKVEVDGIIRGDIRYFNLRQGRTKPTKRGLLIPENTKEFETNVQNLIKSLSEKESSGK